MPMCIQYDDALYSFMIFVLLLYRDVYVPQYLVLADVIFTAHIVSRLLTDVPIL